jgi:PAS domain S-box-containing protein
MELKWTDEASLRRLAEQGLIGDSLDRDHESRDAATLHELLVHKAELEMQNEALRDAQAELTTLHERYRALFDHAPTAYVALDASCRITAANDRAVKLLGETPRAILGARLTRHLIPEEAISFERYRREVLQSHAALAAEFTMVVAGGEQREIRLESAATNGRTAEWYVALTDVTAYNGMVRQLDHDERLRTIQQRSSTIAHSLNNFLYSIQGHADIALHFIEPTAPAYAPLTRMREVVQRCAETTEQLTAFSRSENERPGIVDLNAVIVELQTLLPSLLGADIAAEVQLGASDGAVRLDRTHIEQILLTAVRNARHAMPHGGTFRIQTANVELTDAESMPGIENTHFIRWTLSDTGVGMTANTRDRAFEPFFTTKAPGVGTGLGLSMVKATVERSGGFVKLESAPGRGTKLVVHLPPATGASHVPRSPVEETNRSSPFARILVVDDDVEVASEIAGRLRDAECDVVCAAGGADALDLLRHGHGSLNVLLIDESYPDFVLAQLVRAARELSPSLEVVVAPLALAIDTEGERDDPVEDAVDLALCAAIRACAQ